MYGLILNGIEEMVRTQFGNETWSNITCRASMEHTVFLSLDSYPDELTYRLIQSASDVLGQSIPAILETFGEYWVLYTGRTAYGVLLTPSERTLTEFLQDLDNLHHRLALSMPELRPPSFVCSDISTRGVTVHYYSERRGLAPMMVGLLKGLSVLFNTPCIITRTACREKDADHDQFRLEYL